MSARLVAVPTRKPVEGIFPTTNVAGGNAGLFTLPPAFDTRLHAAMWAEAGVEADFLQQPQQIIGTGLTSVGWQVWKDPVTQGNREVTTRGREGKKYILMFRSRVVQDEVNALYGDKSKADIYKAQMGETIPLQSGAQNPSGMLTEAALQKVDGSLEEPIKPPAPTAQSPTGPVQNVTSTKERT